MPQPLSSNEWLGTHLVDASTQMAPNQTDDATTQTSASAASAAKENPETEVPHTAHASTAKKCPGCRWKSCDGGVRCLDYSIDSRIVCMHLGPPCTTFSVARKPALQCTTFSV